jgi:hypothetical protein
MGDDFMAKNGNLKTFVAVASIILGIVIAGTGIIASAVRVESQVKHHELVAKEYRDKNTIEHKELIATDKELRKECSEQKNSMGKIETEIKYIRKDMNEILTYIRRATCPSKAKLPKAESCQRPAF